MNAGARALFFKQRFSSPRWRRSVALVPAPLKTSKHLLWHRSRSHRAVIRVYDDAGSVIETHERGRFQRSWVGLRVRKKIRSTD